TSAIVAYAQSVREKANNNPATRHGARAAIHRKPVLASASSESLIDGAGFFDLLTRASLFFDLSFRRASRVDMSIASATTSVNPAAASAAKSADAKFTLAAM